MAGKEQIIEIKCSKCSYTYLGWVWQAQEAERLCLDCFACKDHERALNDALGE